MVALMLLATCVEIVSAELCPEMRESLIGRSEVGSVAAPAIEASDTVQMSSDRIGSDHVTTVCVVECESCICCCPHLLVGRPYVQPRVAEGAMVCGFVPFQVPTADLSAPYHPPRI